MGKLKIQTRDGEVQWVGQDHPAGLTPRQRAAQDTGMEEHKFDKFGQVKRAYVEEYLAYLANRREREHVEEN